jgi:hypothetical protein
LVLIGVQPHVQQEGLQLHVAPRQISLYIPVGIVANGTGTRKQLRRARMTPGSMRHRVYDIIDADANSQIRELQGILRIV